MHGPAVLPLLAEEEGGGWKATLIEGEKRSTFRVNKGEENRIVILSWLNIINSISIISPFISNVSSFVRTNILEYCLIIM